MRTRKAFKACILLATALIAVCAAAQIDPQQLKALRKPNTKGADFDQFVDRVYERIAGEAGTGELLPATQMQAVQAFTEIDRHIDPDTYVLGANDEITVYVWGSINEVISAVVDNEGTLILPSVGTISVAGVTLSEAKELVRAKVLEVYHEVDMTVVLSGIRRFKAYVLGNVEKPGAHAVNGATRVSDLIEIAGGFTSQDSARLRGIEIANEARPKRYADLALIFHSNDISANPYLMEGDRVFVRPRTEIVSVFGEVLYPDEYDFVPGDQLGTLLRAAGGCGPHADSSQILLVRFADDGSGLKKLTINLAEQPDFVLRKDDRILVRRKADYRKHFNVWITGEVLHPGRYPILPGTTRLGELIEAAGGFTQDAYLQQSVMYRLGPTGEKIDELDQILEGLTSTSLNPMEKSYLRARGTGKTGLVSVDFRSLYESGGSAEGILLYNGDSIWISPRPLSVEVMGSVVSPGHVNYKEGSDHRYYIKQAGGYNARASRRLTVIIRGRNRVWLRPRDTEDIWAGDKILVPTREYRDWVSVIKDVLIIASSIAAVITTYIAVRNLAD